METRQHHIFVWFFSGDISRTWAENRRDGAAQVGRWGGTAMGAGETTKYIVQAILRSCVT